MNVRQHRHLWACLLAVGFWLAATCAWAAPSFPALSGRVVDQAGVLSPEAEARLSALSESVEQKTGAQFVVASVSSLEDYDIAEYGYQLGRAWGIGQKDGNDGVLLLVAPNERKVRIEVGYGLEGVLTDALTSLILQREVLPRFREGDLEAGVLAGAQAVAAQVEADPERQREATEAAAQRDDSDGGPLIGLFWVFMIVLWIIISASRGGRGRRYRSGVDAALPILLWGLSGGGRGGGGGGFGGGGFSGGGGSFGGGGSSGSW